MGDYEDKYPEAYGRGENPRRSPAEELKLAQTPRQTRDQSSAGLRQRFGLGGASGAPATPTEEAAWRHMPSTPPEGPSRIVEPTARPEFSARTAGNYRGIGPRGYIRSSARIYEDLCDRLTDNPFIDASDIDVMVTGVEVTLRGRVDSIDAARQAESLAQETAGVTHVRNELTLRAAARSEEPTPGDQVNRPLGVPRR